MTTRLFSLIALTCLSAGAFPVRAQAPAPASAPTQALPSAQAAPSIAIPADGAERLQQATLAYNAGIAALGRNDLNVASASFERAVALSPEDAGALSYLGFVRLEQKRWDEALTALEKARELDGGLDARARAQLHNNIGFALWNKGETQRARAAFEQALRLDASYNDARYNLAFVLLGAGEAAGAVTHLRPLIAASPNDAALQEAMAEALEKSGNLPGALGYYKRASELEPRNEAFRFKFALALLSANRVNEAADQMRQVLAVNPNNASALLQLGDLHLRAGRRSEAIAALRRYVGLRGGDFTGRFNLGVALDSNGNWDEALAQYQQAQELRPNDAATRNNIGRIHFKNGRNDEALTHFTRALELDPDFHEARANLALTLAATRRFDESNQQWSRVLAAAADQARGATTVVRRRELSERIAEAQSGLAANLLAQEKWREAADEYRRLLLRVPTDLDARAGLARALFNLRDLSGAEASLREILARDARNANAHNDLGVVLEARNNRQGALDAYEAALRVDPNHAEARANAARLRARAVVS